MTIVLGIEGTAWNLSAAVVDGTDVLVEVTHTYRPASGGIHPREAAQHHAAHIGEVIDAVFAELEAKGISRNEIDAVAFSRGPGLGPCLRIVATAARMISQILQKPLVGVNHCVAHIEVGIWKTEATDPVVLYVSGANSQVLSYQDGAYRVLGETLDIGLGNSLDKFARSAGLPHPGGPLIEKYAKDATCYLELPYTVKGMDFFFSGLSTAATRLLNENKMPEKGCKTPEKGCKSASNEFNEEFLANICHSYQETAFAMAVEVTERALAHTGKSEVLLAGGVGANSRLREMFDCMCQERGARFYVPEKRFMGDNGAMIAYTGLLMYKAGDVLSLEESTVDAGFRADYVSVTWKNKNPVHVEAEIQKMRNGAEAVISVEPGVFGGGFDPATSIPFPAELKSFGFEIPKRKMIIKERISKGYRLDILDSRIRKERTKIEVRMMTEARRAGVLTPVVYGVMEASIHMELIDGIPLKFVISKFESNDVFLEKSGIEVGKMVGKLHAANIIHGDLTTSNMIYIGANDAKSMEKDADAFKIYLIDFGLSATDKTIEAKGVDVHVLFRTLESSYRNADKLIAAFSKGYASEFKNADSVLKRTEEIKLRGRYI
ncbi:bifunctional N(6)-L-threonylcarbamoyladenine synthase/serine/threonine protein kinase [Methanolapillus ohkumae]|uniref:Probable bifunctional tRNA threonylcarbamoyladenosine biosynthesis protein n=1 Tax=Methanolapillus ohkumae TaxID=3028298 RepID=A0AA96VEP8_9EURY|nr:tRNA N6-adenosine threonylcarbamoyltransferase, mitochondrial [Methanosarcinaceae archaeon Am2]